MTQAISIDETEMNGMKNTPIIIATTIAAIIILLIKGKKFFLEEY